MAITTLKQRKDNFVIQLTEFSNGNSYGTEDNKIRFSEFTPSDRRAEPINMKTGKGNNLTLVGPINYGEFTFKVAMEYAETTTNIAQLIADLEATRDYNSDTFHMTVSFVAHTGGSELSEVYRQIYRDCKLLNIRHDDLSSRADDDTAHWTVSCIPTKVERVEIL